MRRVPARLDLVETVPRSVLLVLPVVEVVVVAAAVVVWSGVVLVGLRLVVGTNLHLTEVQLEAGQLGKLFEAQDVVLRVVERRSPLLRLEAVPVIHLLGPEFISRTEKVSIPKRSPEISEQMIGNVLGQIFFLQKSIFSKFDSFEVKKMNLPKMEPVSVLSGIKAETIFRVRFGFSRNDLIISKPGFDRSFVKNEISQINLGGRFRKRGLCGPCYKTQQGHCSLVLN